MAADGSLTFDTGVDNEGFKEGVSTLEKALDRLKDSVDRLSNHIVQTFNGMGETSSAVADQADRTAGNVENIGVAAERSARKVEKLEEQMGAVSVSHWNDAPTGSSGSDGLPATAEWSGERGYDKSAMQFLEDYEDGVHQAEQHTNEYRREIESLKEQMHQMESRGMYFGDEEYDEAFLKLQKLEQALKDYKKELVSPTADANPFGLDTIFGKVLELDMQLRRLAESGKGLGDAEYDAIYRKLAIAKEEAKAYAAELAKTPKMIEEENQKLAEQEAKRQAAAQKEAKRLAEQQARIDARIAKEEQLLQTQRAKEVQEALEQKRLAEIAGSAQVASIEVVRLREELARLNARQKDLEKAGLGYGYAEYDANAQKIANITVRLKEYKRELYDAKEKTSSFSGVVKGAFSTVGKYVERFGKSLERRFSVQAKQAVTNIKSMVKPTQKASKSILKLSNMFGLMLIRMAMRSVIQGFKDGMQNLVQYSDEANRSVSEFTSSMTYLKNGSAAAFAPILSVAVPNLSTFINFLATAVGYINQFFTALGGSSTYTKAVKVNKDYAASLEKTGGAAKSAGQDAKKALAPFDDLVQIQQEGTNSSGGGGTGSVDPSQMFTEETIDSGISGFANKLKELFEAEDWTGIGRLIGGKVNEAVLSFGDYISWDNVGVEVTAFVLAFTAILNSAVGTIDWYSVGVSAGNGINTLFNTLYLLLTEIDWALLGTALAYGLNGMVDTVDWNLFGATIGAYFQARISGLYGFVSTADWPGIGQAIGSSLMGMTNQIDWSMLGLTFALGLNGVFDVLGNAAMTYDWTNLGSSLAMSLSIFFQNFDWAGSAGAVSTIIIGLLDALITFIAETDWMAVGEGVAVALENIDWATIAARLWTVFWNAVFSAFAVLGSFLGTLIVDGVTAAKEYFQGKIEECGGDIWLGIAKGILDAIKGIGKWVNDHIFSPFIDAFKNAFGIHSPSKVMAEMGQYLWDGFCDGIKEFFSNPGDFIKANITDPFINGIKNFLGIHSPSTVMEGIGSNTVAGFNQGVTNEQSASQNVIQSWAEGVAKWFSNKFGIGNNDAEESRKWATSIMSGFNSTVNRQYTNSQSAMEVWAEHVRSWFVGTSERKGVNEPTWKKFADDVVRAFVFEIDAMHIESELPMRTWAENVRKWFIGSGVTAGVNESSWAKFGGDIILAFRSKISGSHTETRESIESWSAHVREWFWGDSNTVGTGGLYAAFYNMAKRINEGFSNGIGDFAHMAKAAIREWAEEVMDEAEEEFDIHSPSREFHAIAEYVIKGFNEGISDMASTSQTAAQRWLDSVLGVFDGVDVSVPVGLDIPNAASYLPKMASGSIVPPKAGEMSSSMRNSAAYSQEEALSSLISKIEELMGRMQEDGERPTQIVLQLTGNLASLARILKPELDKEASRKGVSLVVVGGT